MAYEASKDKVIAEQAITLTEREGIKVGVYSYNDGTPKLGMTRYIQRKDGEIRPDRIGRITLAELRLIYPIMVAMGKTMAAIPAKQ